ncbi:MAG: hypothetical protein LBM64_08300 [Deltaproteobacteria bacterium]|nr:hypothetical protein [Deltaproteobacteria bacterium]
MKTFRMSAHLAMLLALCFVSVLFGCSRPNIPAAVAYKKPEAQFQLQVQATAHWREVAADVGERVVIAHTDRPDIHNRPIFIAMPNNRPFSLAFYNLLRTELVSRGLQVSYNREPGGLVLEYTIQTVLFNPSRGDNDRSNASPSEHEVIVNSRMFYQNRFVMHCSAVRYINDDDLALYLDPQAADPMSESGRDIRVVNK